MLIVAVAVVVAIAFFTIRFVSNRSASKEATAGEEAVSQEIAAEGTEAEDAASLTASDDQSALTQDVSDELRENDPIEVGNLVRNYYIALSNKDIPSLRGLVDFISDDEVASLITDKTTTFSQVTAYMKKGADPDTYVAYASYKYSNDEVSDMPGLSQLYVIKNSAGDYVVKSEDLTEKEQALIDSLNSDPEVQQLIYKVQREYENAKNQSDAGESGSEDSNGGSDASETETEQEAKPAESTEEDSENEESSESSESSSDVPRSSDEVWTSSIVKDCNVREKPSYKGKVMGVISEGTEVTVYGNADSGWYHISGGGYDGYVGHSFVR